MLTIKHARIGHLNDVGGLVGSLAYHFLGREPAYAQERLRNASDKAAFLINMLIKNIARPLPDAVYAINSACRNAAVKSDDCTCEAVQLPDGSGALRVRHENEILFEIHIVEAA